jgi:hypothetical protein
VEEKLMLMMQSYQQELANEQAKRIQAEADLQISRKETQQAREEVASLKRQLDGDNDNDE